MEQQKSKSWGRRGFEWIGTGAALIIGGFLLPWAAPLALTMYGGYHWFLLRQPKQGAAIIGTSLILWVLLMGPLSGLLWPLKALGAVFAGSGVVMLMLSKKQEQLPGDDQSLIVDPKDKQEEN